jgi:hypothetical protein
LSSVTSFRVGGAVAPPELTKMLNPSNVPGDRSAVVARSTATPVGTAGRMSPSGIWAPARRPVNEKIVCGMGRDVHPDPVERDRLGKRERERAARAPWVPSSRDKTVDRARGGRAGARRRRCGGPRRHADSAEAIAHAAEKADCVDIAPAAMDAAGRSARWNRRHDATEGPEVADEDGSAVDAVSEETVVDASTSDTAIAGCVDSFECAPMVPTGWLVRACSGWRRSAPRLRAVPPATRSPSMPMLDRPQHRIPAPDRYPF